VSLGELTGPDDTEGQLSISQVRNLM